MNHIETDDRGLLVACPNCGKRNRLTYERLGQTFRCGQCHNDLPPPSAPADVTSEAAFNGLTGRSPLPVLVDFWAPWCGPCKMVAPILEKLSQEYDGKVVVAKVNTDDNPEWAMKYGVQGIPTMLFVSDGKIVHRQVGALPERMLREAVSQFLELAGQN